MRLPLILFLLTCVSTFIAGATGWMPLDVLGSCLRDGGGSTIDLMPLRHAMVVHWQDGLIYMGGVILILGAHEMGHFLATVWYGVPASLPYFIPLPISTVGTVGAVIGMNNRSADRKEMFDIGIAGPLAGLVFTIPILWLGIRQLDLTLPKHGGLVFEMPLAVRWAVDLLRPGEHAVSEGVWISQMNPCFMAGWFGLLVTALNMMPVSQLDGGHVTYTLFGRASRWIARGFLMVSILYVVLNWKDAYVWTLMLVLVVLIGPDHPPTRNDERPLGWFRVCLGIASLSIPVLCFSPKAILMR